MQARHLPLHAGAGAWPPLAQSAAIQQSRRPRSTEAPRARNAELERCMGPKPQEDDAVGGPAPVLPSTGPAEHGAASGPKLPSGAAQTRRAGCFCGCAGPSGRSRAQPMGWGPPRGPCGGPDLRAPNAAASTVPPRVLQVCAAPRPVGPGPTRRTQRVASNPCPGPCKPLRP